VFVLINIYFFMKQRIVSMKFLAGEILPKPIFKTHFITLHLFLQNK